ncbi:MAG TPA: alpha/beta hydrolase [Streptosporangiaceae bacterium]
MTVPADAWAWDMIDEGPRDAAQSILFLPGGMCSAGLFAELMAEPVLSRTRRVAVTLPGHAGAEPAGDLSTEEYARLAAELASKLAVSVVVGFSLGATVAYEMAVSGAYKGPVVMIGSSLSAADEPAILRVIDGLGSLLGTLPAAAFKTMAAAMAGQAKLSAERRRELKADFARNDPRALRQWLRGYVQWLHRDDDPAQRLCEAGNRTWVIHAEKGDGGLTAHERAVLEACDHVQVITRPGRSYFLPNEDAAAIATVIVEALAPVR